MCGSRELSVGTRFPCCAKDQRVRDATERRERGSIEFQAKNDPERRKQKRTTHIPNITSLAKLCTLFTCSNATWIFLNCSAPPTPNPPNPPNPSPNPPEAAAAAAASCKPDGESWLNAHPWTCEGVNADATPRASPVPNAESILRGSSCHSGCERYLEMKFGRLRVLVKKKKAYLYRPDLRDPLVKGRIQYGNGLRIDGKFGRGWCGNRSESYHSTRLWRTRVRIPI